ncbi:MAG: carboxy terminal-processing peptidase [Planctomycetia bacterium]|nr:carboxy terminal-processing peptidase [Planctomycetia bacterium]
MNGMIQSGRMIGLAAMTTAVLLVQASSPALSQGFTQPPAVVAPADRPVIAAPSAPTTPPASAAIPSQPAAPPAGMKPGTNDRHIAVAVRRQLEREHFLRKPIDDEMAQRWFAAFLEALDPMKVYFLQSDVDGFMQKRDSLDDLVKRGDVTFAYEVLDRFLQRVDSRLPLIERLIQGPQDFTAPESIVIDRDETKWARSDAEAEDLWKRRIKYDLLVQKMEKTPSEEAKDKLLRRYRSLAKRWHQMTADELLETYLSSLTSSFDPHTSYMSPGTLENFEIGMRLQLDGIGAQLKGEDGYTTIVELTPGGAADRDGRLKSKDRVVGVGQGGEGEIVDVVDMNLNEVVKLIRGKRGTVVRLKVIPVGETAPKVYDITRAKIELKDAEARGEVIEHGKKADGSPYRIGVINLPSFYMDMAGAQQGQAEFKSSTRDCKRLLDEFRQKGVDCVALDLRSNGGGSLPESIKLTGLFIDKGPVVQIKDADKQVRPYDDVDQGVAWDGPLVVLTSKFSASASEILAGAIQDYHRGLIVGDKSTHGKGTVQTLLDVGRQLFPRFDNVPSLGAIKVTIQQFYRPSGDSTQLEGVKSDVEIPSITSHLPIGECDLDHAITFDKVPRADFQSTGRVTDGMVAKLREESAKRVATNKEFEKLSNDIARYEKRKDEKTISLVETEFAKQWNEGKAAEDEEEKKLEELEMQKKPVVRRDFSFDEAMNVTIDYLRALSGATGLTDTAKVQESTPAR